MSTTVTLWDKDFNRIGDLPASCIRGGLPPACLRGGDATIELPVGDPMAAAILDHTFRATTEVRVTIDHDGTRWSGRTSTVTLTRPNVEVQLVGDATRSSFDEFLASLPEVRL